MTDCQGKRPDQVAASELIAGVCLAVALILGIAFCLTACGRAPTEPETATLLPCGVRNVPVTPGDSTVRICTRTP